MIEIKEGNTVFVSKISHLIIWLTGLALTVLSIALNFFPIIRLILIIGVFILGTGFLLVKNFNLEFKAYEYVVYSFGVGLAYMLFGGMMINFILPLVGYMQPLSLTSSLLFLSISYLLLLLRAYYSNRIGSIEIRIENFSNIFYIFPSIGLFFLTVIGTQLLNNGGNGFLVYVAFVLFSFLILYLFFTDKKINESVYVFTIFFLALSLLLSFSLRSNHILGWDINEEFQVFTKTLENLNWKMSHYPNLDYNSCLSITILPTTLKVLSGISPEYIFKLVFQIIFAFLPVSIFVLSRRYLDLRYAFLTVVLFVSQPWFFEQMPSIIRQEISFLFYTLTLLVVFDKGMPKIAKGILSTIFFLSIIISHYSTSYLFIILISGTFILAKLFSIRGGDGFKNRNIGLVLLLVPLIFLFLWQVPITGTGQALSKFYKPLIGQTNTASTTSTNLINGNPSFNSGSKSEASQNTVNESYTLQELLKSYTEQYRDKPSISTYNDIEALSFVPDIITEEYRSRSLFSNFINQLIRIITQLANYFFVGILSVIGVVYSLYILYLKKDDKDTEFVALNLVGVCLVILMELVPYLNVHYNFTRLFLQVFITLSIFSIIGGILITNLFSSSKNIILGLTVWLLFIFGSGILSEVSGGVKKIIYNQVPAAGDSYFISDKEVYSAKWISENIKIGEMLQADVIANLRLQSFANINAENRRIFPQTLYKDGFVYLIQKNIDGIAYYNYRNTIIRYGYPIDFLENKKDLIYNNTGSRIYR